MFPSIIVGVVAALIVYRIPHPPRIPSDPSYLPEPHRSYQPPPLHTRPFPQHNCLAILNVSHQTATVYINPPTNAPHTLHYANVNVSITNSSVHTLSHLLPDSHYTIALRASYTICTSQFVTLASSTNLVANPSFETVAQPPFLASTFHPSQRDSPASWTPFYNGGARRVCGVIPLSENAFAYPKAANCVLALGRLFNHVQFHHSPHFYGAHQSVRLDLSAVVVSAWYLTSPNIEYVQQPQSKLDSLSIVISWLLDDGTQSDGILIPLTPSNHWKPVCAYITAPRGRHIHTLHIFFHMHDFRQGALLIDDVAVFKPYFSATSWNNTCYTPPPEGLASSPSPNPICTHLTSIIRPQQKQLTIAVPLTADRVLRLEAMSRLYAGGPIVAAVIVHDEKEVAFFRSIWHRKKWLRSHVDVMFVRRSDAPIPINAVRNIAVRLATTDYVVMLDVDMTPATHAFACFRDPSGKFLEGLLPPGEKRIATLPVFITDVHHRSARDKDELVNMLQQRVATSYCLNSQKSNKIKRWYMNSEASQTRFTTDYEPYGIVRRDLHPMYDERFSGYGFNKIAWAVEAEGAGWRMFVLPDHFVTHLNHVENEWVSSINVAHYLQTWRRYFAFVAEISGGNHNDAIPKYEMILAVFPVTEHLQRHPPSAKLQALISRHLSRFLLPATHIRLEQDYLAELAAIAKPHRPPHRTAQLSPDYPYATIHPDVALHFGSSTVLVEIKPKYALLSRSRLIPPQQATVLGKYTVPTYHIKNYVLPNGSVPEVPYNPSDLLSMDIAHVTAAVDTLRREKARSLRVFNAGILADPNDHTAALSAASHALVAAKQCCAALLDLQGYDILDNAGAEILLTRLERLIGKPKAHSLIREQLYCDSQYDSVSEKLCYKSPREAAAYHCMASYSDALESTEELNAQQCARLLARFMQAAAAKDCSLLIALCPASEAYHVEGNRLVTAEGMEWMFRIWAVDVGEKSISKILDKWAPEDRRRTQILEGRKANG